MNGEIDHILFEDEWYDSSLPIFAIQLVSGRSSTQNPYVRAASGRQTVRSIKLRTGQVHYRDGEAYDAPAFIRFLEFILQEYPTGNIVMMLDNGRIHNAAQIQTFLQKHPRLQFVFLPKYSPDLNPIEGLWKWLKSDVVHNVFYKKFYHIRINVAAFMKRVNAEPMNVIDRLCIRI
ncbi:IS630 family transposase [Paenibacillus terreus]|uniref:IS630 family transposase n=1 Tax=Paenibacillus terreus TaxID=1387834 RepID=A0ABV5B9N1_9BACL